MEDKYVAFYACNCEHETFVTHELAEKWLNDCYEANVDDGYSEESINGFDYIAKITHRSMFTETDNKKNYHKHNDTCDEDCDQEEWPYNNDFEFVGEITFKEII